MKIKILTLVIICALNLSVKLHYMTILGTGIKRDKIK